MTHPSAELEKHGMCSRLSDTEWAAVCSCCIEVRSWPAKSLISRKGEAIDRSLLLMEGLVGRHVPGPHRDLRELVALEVRGDFVDLHSFPIGTLDHDVTAMTDVRVAVFPHEKLRDLVRSSPDAAIALWAQTVVDASIHRYWSFRIGALRAAGRVANFLCEMHSRLDMAGLATEHEFDLALTQTDIGEACGMSPVHVNRVLRELREGGCCTVRDGKVSILNRSELRRVGQYTPDFLEIGL